MDRKRLYDVCVASEQSGLSQMSWENVINQEVEERKKELKFLDDILLERPDQAELVEQLRSIKLTPVLQLLNGSQHQLTLQRVAAILQLVEDASVYQGSKLLPFFTTECLTSWVKQLGSVLLGSRNEQSDYSGTQIAMFMTLYDLSQTMGLNAAKDALIRLYRKMDAIDFFGLYVGTHVQVVDNHIQRLVQCAQAGMLASQARYKYARECGI